MRTVQAKRIERKLAARVRPARSEDESAEEPLSIPGRGKHEDTSKLIQFNCPEVLDFSSGTVVLPLRITCYCRHHREKTGFNVHFTVFDHSGRIVGSGITRPIMITDDHKSTGVSKAVSSAGQTPESDWTLRSLGERPDAGGSQLAKRKAGEERASKKRTKPYDGRRSGKLSRRTSIGSLNSTVPSAFATRPSTPALSHGGSSPEQVQRPEPGTPDFSDHGAPAVVSSMLPSAIAPPIVANESNAFNDILMPDVGSEPPLASVPLSSFLAHDMSPVHSSSMHSPEITTMPAPQSLEIAQSLHYLFNAAEPPSLPTLPQPTIHRLIPSQGPTYGGIEITVLGANFHPNMQLNCVFGDARSTSTQRWSDNTLVCILPPSPTPGVVAVWFDGVQKEEDGSPPALFAYQDETDRALYVFHFVSSSHYR